MSTAFDRYFDSVLCIIKWGYKGKKIRLCTFSKSLFPSETLSTVNIDMYQFLYAFRKMRLRALVFFFYLSESNSVPVVISWQHSLHAKIMWIYDIVSFDVLAGPRWWLYSLSILHVFIRGNDKKNHFIWDGVPLQIPHLIRNKAEIFA